ncbi:MAG TPA: DUF2461 domain-containing protein [Humisphaera sp.]
MPAKAPHLSPKAISFFRGLEKNNTREWFTPRKAVYEAEVRGPMREIAAWVNDRLRGFAVDHVWPDPAKALYRIYRDTRFSKDKTPYKTHAGAIYPRRGLPKHGGAGYYFGVSGKEVQIAGGVYGPEPEQLAAVRAAIVADPEALPKLGADKRRAKLTGPLGGDQVSRTPKGFDADPASPLGQLLRRKQIYFYVELPVELATTPKLGPEVVKRFEAMAPAVDWLNAAILAAAKDDGDDGRPKRPAPMF